jgi:hypothetical protein
MPIVTPVGITFLIADLENEVILRTENRTTDTARADVWIRDSLIEITSDPDFRNEFVELEEYGPTFNLTPQQQEYPEFTNLIPVGDVNVATLDILIWQDPPTNSIRRKLIQSHYQKADNFQPTFSLPTEWYRFALTIGFTPVPDKAYQIQTRMLRAHPINDNQLNQTQILIPRDWNEVLVWCAVERGFLELLEYEKAAKVHVHLHGDPKHPDRIGIYEGKKKQREREAWRTETPLRPVYRRSCYGA